MVNNKKTFFIVLEGGDGVGKSSQIRRLTHTLQNHGFSVAVTREPGGCEPSEKIRNVIMDNDFSNITELLLFTASRYENIINNIKPQIGVVDFILCDRFILSTIVYQSILGNVELDKVLKLHEIINFNLYPDLTLIIDIDPNYAYNRLSNRNENILNKIDKKPKEWHHKILNAFKQYKNFYNAPTAVINGSLTLTEVHVQIIKSINNNLNLKIPY